jgi:hypothetical protein
MDMSEVVFQKLMLSEMVFSFKRQERNPPISCTRGGGGREARMMGFRFRQIGQQDRNVTPRLNCSKINITWEGSLRVRTGHYTFNHFYLSAEKMLRYIYLSVLEYGQPLF